GDGGRQGHLDDDRARWVAPAALRRVGVSLRSAIGYVIVMTAPRSRPAEGPAGSSSGESFLGRALKRIVRDGASDHVAIEEPLEIRVDGEPLAVTMRTPGDDEELAAGFLFGEGLIDDAPRVAPPADLAANTIEVAGPLLRRPARRSFYATSSCGVCGKGA